MHIAHAGLDQRKAHVIARDVATHIRINALHAPDGHVIKPAAVHHPLLLGLRKPPMWPVPEDRMRDAYAEMKMSKSDPQSAVFVHDSPDDIRAKVRRAFCPPGTADFNPVLDWIDKLGFGVMGGPFTVHRSAENGGDVSYRAYGEVRDAYVSGALHPMDAKAALADHLVELLAPVRAHFERPEIGAMLGEAERAAS